MGFASLFHEYVDAYVDDLPARCTTLVVGPGSDTADLAYWSARGECFSLDPNVMERDVPWHPMIGTLESIAPHISRPGGVYDVVWATHVLEHSRNPGQFLDACYDLLHCGGHLFISVPPLKHDIVGGHVSLWNMGILWYHLILAGFDVRQGSFAHRGYNLFGHVRKSSSDLLSDVHLRYDAGDIEALAEKGLWPNGFHARQEFNGLIDEWNWPKCPRS